MIEYKAGITIEWLNAINLQREIESSKGYSYNLSKPKTEQSKPEIDKFQLEIGLLTKLRDFYKQYETNESKRRIQALREIENDLNNEGLEAAIFVNGSLSFGMSEKGSDIEFMYIGDTSAYSSDNELQEDIGKRLEEKLGYEVEIDLNGTCDLNKARVQLENPEEGFSELISLYKWSKIDLPLNDSNNRLVMQIGKLRYSHLQLNNALNGDSHIPGKKIYCRSFEKYNARLEKRGIEVPDDIEGILAQFAGYISLKILIRNITQNT